MADELEPYRPYIDNFDLTEEQKLELVNTIAHIAQVILDKKYSKMVEKPKGN